MRLVRITIVVFSIAAEQVRIWKYRVRKQQLMNMQKWTICSVSGAGQDLQFIGVDGCRGGWLCVACGVDGAWQIHLLKTIEALGDLVAASALTLIDMPIGLPDANGPGQRQCDMEARRCLGWPRASSVFPVPSRATLTAHSYSEALQINRQQLGRGLSRQAWNIAPKIAQVDDLLRSRPVLKSRLRECHPEVCFWSLNRHQAMRFNKKRAEGREERLQVIQAYFPPVREMLHNALAQFQRSVVAADDVIDAMVVALTAKLGQSGLLSLPSEPPRDHFGLPMEIVYADGRNRVTETDVFRAVAGVV